MELFNLKFIFSVLFALISFSCYSQENNIFSSSESLRAFLDEKTYSVTGYGSITFNYNSSLTKSWKEKREKDKSDDEQLDVVFDLSIKRNLAKKKDKADYQILLRVDLSDPQGQDYNPILSYSNVFLVTRNVIYPIKDFPSVYILFADGDLYFEKTIYKQVALKDYKTSVLLNTKPIAFNSPVNLFASTKYVKCVEEQVGDKPKKNNSSSTPNSVAKMLIEGRGSVSNTNSSNALELTDWLEGKRFQSKEIGLIVQYGYISSLNTSGFTFINSSGDKFYHMNCSKEISSDQSLGVFTECINPAGGGDIGVIKVYKTSKKIIIGDSTRQFTYNLIE
jgi:hypothetical protein